MHQLREFIFKLKIILLYGFNKNRVVNIGRMFLSILGGCWLVIEVYAFVFENSLEVEATKKYLELNSWYIIFAIFL